MSAYYNEIDPYAAQWLRNLIEAGHIAPGIVDERSITQIKADELAGYAQCHFFAGIGVWSYALRLAGWPDERPVWTGSCPCQPFSAAGKGEGFGDERHLWPAWFKLIGKCRPRTVFGEQVASKDGLAWLDLVHFDLESAGYAVGAVDTCAAGFGAPHIRQRFFFVADADGGDAGAEGIQRSRQHGQQPQDGRADCELADADIIAGGQRRADRGRRHQGSAAQSWAGFGGSGIANQLGHAEQPGLEGHSRYVDDGHESGRLGAIEAGPIAEAGATGGLVDAGQVGREVEIFHDDGGTTAAGERKADVHRGRSPVNGFWSHAEWLPCIDGKARPVEPGTFPLAHGASARMGRLRAYGNAINAEVAREFVESFIRVNGC